MTELNGILESELLLLKNNVIRNHEQAGQLASKKTRDSLVVETSKFHGTLSGASYIGVLETGRRGGKVPYDFIDILKCWATAKNITFESESDFNRWAYFVKKKIQKEGSKLFRSGVRNDIFTTEINNFTDRLSEAVGTSYQTEVINNIFNF